jgi:hypothetical protein
MKLTSLTVLSAAAALAGCGTLAQTDSATADNVDYATVNAINNVARIQGVQVHWINFPQKAKTSTASKPGGAS